MPAPAYFWRERGWGYVSGLDCCLRCSSGGGSGVGRGSPPQVRKAENSLGSEPLSRLMQEQPWGADLFRLRKAAGPPLFQVHSSAGVFLNAEMLCWQRGSRYPTFAQRVASGNEKPSLTDQLTDDGNDNSQQGPADDLNHPVAQGFVEPWNHVV